MVVLLTISKNSVLTNLVWLPKLNNTLTAARAQTSVVSSIVIDMRLLHTISCMLETFVLKTIGKYFSRNKEEPAIAPPIILLII
jgi:hypothetical protein